ncbi:GAF domain-containing protein [Solirubrobacter soli]|uniref:GAF domain-containing protein n=1 Tax=Solirubrobacter soli TaxID=363832 RepID=UPI0004261472|nr:GAF domain-containing protein [Solirubrobacter soli]
MRATTVRFGDDLWDLLEAEASSQGISAAQFVRDATIMRLGVISGRRGDFEGSLTLQELAAGAITGRPAGSEDDALRDPARLEALHASGLLDSPADDAFDRITRLASRVLNAPVALISLVDADRQFFKSSVGLDEPWHSERETPLSHSICRHALQAEEPLVIEDARVHPLVRDNLAVRDLEAVAYAGIPLVTGDGHALGTLCVLDHHPRHWTRDQIETLEALGASVMSEMELALGRQAP